MRKIILGLLASILVGCFTAEASTTTTQTTNSSDPIKKRKAKKIKKPVVGQKQIKVKWNIGSEVETDASNWRKKEYFT